MIKKWLMINLVASLFVLGLGSPGMAKIVTQEEALNVAKNWITLVLHTQKKWGQSKTAHVADVQEFKRNGKVLGYFCKVRPRGFIVISLHRRLPPVKAYSETSDLDPASEKEIADLLKMKMKRYLAAMEEKAGRLEVARDEDLEGVFEFDHRPAWRGLESSPSVFENLIRLQQQTLVGSPILLSTSWHQTAPYNDHCPDMGCILDPDNGVHNTNAHAGCIAIAGAQVMRYWAWPAFAEFSWPNMLDRYDWSASFQGFHGPNGDPVTNAQVWAVANVVRKVGYWAGMVYSCTGSAAYLFGYEGSDLFDALVNRFGYVGFCWSRFMLPSAEDWFDLIKANIDAGIPLPYTVEKHSIVCDGWKEYWYGGVVNGRQYHMNWGHDNGGSMWYWLGGLPGGGVEFEKMITDLKPYDSMGSDLYDITYPRPDGVYRYFPYNTSAENVVFEAGQYLQFHHNIRIWGSNADFIGAPDLETRMFSGGINFAENRFTGIAILDGKISLQNSGTIRFPRPVEVAPPHDSIGVFRSPSQWYLDTNGNGHYNDGVDTVINNFGLAGDVAIVGDWSGSGTKKIGVKRGTEWWLDYNGNGVWDGGVDRLYNTGWADHTPVAGDWNGDGIDEIGSFSTGGYYYLDLNGDGAISNCTTDLCFPFGSAGEIPVVGDWNGDGSVKVGTFKDGVWKLDYDGDRKYTGPPNDREYTFGQAKDSPVVGDWSGNGVTKIGVTRPGGKNDEEILWYLDYDGNGSLGDCWSDRCYSFGIKGDQPVSGRW